MSARELKYPPLVEAIFEIRWKLQGPQPGPQSDPNYMLLLSRLYDRLHDDYPEHEQLPAAKMPDEFMGHIVQHRFRVGENKWPLVQIGPGILTVNSIKDSYESEDFICRIESLTKSLLDAHPDPEDLDLTSLVLRYINADGYDFDRHNIHDDMSTNMGITVSFPDSLFNETDVAKKPIGFSLQSSYRSSNPAGTIAVRFSRGQTNNLPALVWETVVESTETDIPELSTITDSWSRPAHDIIEDWFFKLINGNLLRKYTDE